jgi:hypothetical protein
VAKILVLKTFAGLMSYGRARWWMDLSWTGPVSKKSMKQQRALIQLLLRLVLAHNQLRLHN